MPDLYARVVAAFPDAWIEDPFLVPATSKRARAASRRASRGTPAIHEWGDVEALPFAPRRLNCKPSRFGSIRRLFDFYDALRPSTGSRCTAAASSSSAPGRAQIQLLASLFHPDAPNDVAPGGYNATEPPPACREPARAQRAAGLPSRRAFAASRPTDSSPASPSGYHAAPSHGSPRPTSR